MFELKNKLLQSDISAKKLDQFSQKKAASELPSKPPNSIRQKPRFTCSSEMLFAGIAKKF